MISLFQALCADGHHEVEKILETGFAPHYATGELFDASLVRFRPEIVPQAHLNCPGLEARRVVKEISLVDEKGEPYQWACNAISDAEIEKEWKPILDRTVVRYGSAKELNCQFCGVRFSSRRARLRHEKYSCRHPGAPSHSCHINLPCLEDCPGPRSYVSPPTLYQLGLSVTQLRARGSQSPSVSSISAASLSSVGTVDVTRSRGLRQSNSAIPAANEAAIANGQAARASDMHSPVDRWLTSPSLVNAAAIASTTPLELGLELAMEYVILSSDK